MDALSYLKELISFPSVSSTSNDAVTNYVADSLTSLGFETEKLDYQDKNGVLKSSVVAKRGHGGKGIGYFAHTDVVPAEDWLDVESGPFQPVIRDEKVYARGSCDMKGSLACFLAACASVSVEQQSAPIYVTCTADEEVGFTGAADVVARSQFYREMVNSQTPAIIGEPTLLSVVHAHKGVGGFRVISHGKAAHSSTRDGVNANLAMIPFLQEMQAIYQETETAPQWQNDEFDPPTVTWNIGINDHTPAVNITPPQSVCTVYFRPMPGMESDQLFSRVKQLAEKYGLEYVEEIRGDAVYTDPKSPFVEEMLELAGAERSRTVSYGTDGAMFTELENLVVCGPGGIAQAHTHDEWISLKQLELGTALYQKVIERYCQ
ncbi:MAG: M20 family metallopeptidase [Planctomycetaceae bacterium]|jgi:acetylornithine deacetylase|nr:M20 family metallopeptidase [Planctomycetaceae bacterium]MDG2388870.1 M20 family metallopeptidase [Planctomycetaceae bacterium]